MYSHFLEGLSWSSVHFYKSCFSLHFVLWCKYTAIRKHCYYVHAYYIWTLHGQHVLRTAWYIIFMKAPFIAYPSSESFFLNLANGFLRLSRLVTGLLWRYLPYQKSFIVQPTFLKWNAASGTKMKYWDTR